MTTKSRVIRTLNKDSVLKNFGVHTQVKYLDPDGYRFYSSEHVVVTYHDTNVVEFTDGMIFLSVGTYTDANGKTRQYRTATTKRRMNQASEYFGLGYKVFQRNFKWYIEERNGAVNEWDSSQSIIMLNKENAHPVNIISQDIGGKETEYKPSSSINADLGIKLISE